jgi:hypothetical protein
VRVTLLGHATLLVEAGVNVLMDPWLVPPGERTTDVCPRRVVHVERLPRIDAVVISHRHGDHFDPESLELVPGRPPVYCADDPELRAGLEELGIRDSQPLVPGRAVRLGPLTLHPTASAAGHPEVGVVFAADSLVWNQVDTVVTQAEAVRVRRLFERALDVAFVGYNPILEHVLVWPEEVDFPHERYQRLLETALASGAALLVPGSSQERRSDAGTPFNHRLFPVTPSRFAADVQAIAPGQRVQPLLPGQALRIEAGDVVVEESDCVTRLEDDRADIAFDPTRPVPALAETGSMRASAAALRATLRAVMLHHFPGRAQERLDAGELGPLRHLADRRHRVVLRFWLPGVPATAVDYVVRSWWPVEVMPVQAEAAEPTEAWHYRFEYLASEIHERAMQLGQRPVMVRAFRNRAVGGPLPPLEPARLHGIDPYFTVDTTYEWHPLEIFA